MEKIIVKDKEISVRRIKNKDYLCLTDMLKAKDGEFFITVWLRNRNTLEYIGIWEKVYNPTSISCRLLITRLRGDIIISEQVLIRMRGMIA